MSDIHRGKDEVDPAVRCAECMKETLKSQAYDPEGMDYEENFCAVECYEAWNRKLVSDREKQREEGVSADADDAPSLLAGHTRTPRQPETWGGTMKIRTLHSACHHCGWDNSLEPAMRVVPGETVELAALEASGGRITRASGHADVLRLDAARANPVTGPIWVDGAQPGDALVVELQDFVLSGWGWTAIIPGFGLLAEDFGDAYLHVSSHDSRVIELTPEIHLPIRPFAGTIGVAPAEAGRHSAIPARAVGGNLDCRDMVAGARLLLPVAVPGALFSLGDTHAAQGDGEVCGTAIESPMTVRVRFDLVRDARLRAPRLELPAAAAPPPGSQAVTFGIGPDLRAVARDAVREMIDLITAEYGLTPELAYCLCSVAAHLRISEVVNAPNWVVSAYLPRTVFR